MPRGRKKQEEIDVSKMRDIETYEHKDKKRKNNPPVGMAQHDTAPESKKTYAFDPHIDPTLEWAGKKEGLSFDVPTSSIHIHESIKPHKIIGRVQNQYSEALKGQLVGQQSMFEAETPAERMRRRRESIEFYKHGVDWTNRLIAGDSLVIMNSLLEKEGMAGQVQMVYIDPPYGIKYGSNFQPFVDKRDVKDKKDDDLTQEPEMIKAFRDTWELGIHSYLTYLRNRLLLTRELLSENGSVFVQISDENVHHVREICDEIFGKDNFICLIGVEKTSGTSSNYLATINDYIVWYGKTKDIKYRQLYKAKELGKEGATQYVWLDINGEDRRLTREEILAPSTIPCNGKVFAADNCTSTGKANSEQPFDYQGITYYPSSNAHWKPVYPQGMEKLAEKGRLKAIGNSLMYKRFLDDFPVVPISNIWNDTKMTGFTETKIYVVQTSLEAIKRCLLMTTDPGDLVLDITCGSGTTAYVAEQWGRRWITCDTSRVAITLAKKRLMTATFDYYKLAHEEQGVAGGFVYKTVPHITLKSIANNEPPATETLYDQPEVDKSKIRISGPFTVEALPAPVVKPLDDAFEITEDDTAKQSDWRDELLATGILGRGGAKIEFSRVEPLSGTTYLQAEAETKEDVPRRAVICFADETKPMDSRVVSLALTEAEDLRPSPKLIIFAAFQFDPEAAKDIDNTNWSGVTCLKVQMNTDLMTEDLKKKRSSNQSFWLVGQPDVELIHIEKGKDKGKYKVKVNGFDYYDVKKGTVESGNSGRIAMWMLDTNYDGMCIEPMQVFFPLGGKKDGWNKLAKTLKAEIDQELIEQYAGTESLPFSIDGGAMIAVKIIDDRGIESLKVLKVGG
ncbi:site-specific DNA-methyltransferase [Caproiciproducens galactitolivorans]|uniref:Site-specific DNA-methyltransferase n=1 Tax=Caproiciproducens galactitolivorans TaxID=642589 RepID=A0ABT4BSZ5_9FIRM|nr:site-specific DNA-methyltransferase [Caproiciproducens galactitolivorans]MCY1714019.1 site-specific DNA-methyltransferase [Caproiciproducens galactitolivorans]